MVKLIIQCPLNITRFMGSKGWYRDISESAINRTALMSHISKIREMGVKINWVQHATVIYPIPWYTRPRCIESTLYLIKHCYLIIPDCLRSISYIAHFFDRLNVLVYMLHFGINGEARDLCKGYFISLLGVTSVLWLYLFTLIREYWLHGGIFHVKIYRAMQGDVKSK